MTFRAIVQDGFIVINTRGELPDGTRVRVIREGRLARAKKPIKSPRTPKQAALADLPAIGMWKNRPEWKGKSTLRIAQELREKSLGGRRRG